MFTVDVVTLLEPGKTIPEPVLAALGEQGLVTVRHHVIDGPRQPGEDRISAIARARNRAREVGDAHYVMFLDSDVVLPPLGIERLIYGLIFNPAYAALGINYQDAVSLGAAHVAMGAVLFYRPILAQIQFRSGPNMCECYGCCIDLRAMGYGIDYLPDLRAEHLRGGPRSV